MQRLTCQIVFLMLVLGILLPVFAMADATNEDIRSQRQRIIRRMKTNEQTPAPSAPTTAVAPATSGQNSSDDPTYGFSKENPVKLGGADPGESVDASYYYLKLLRDSNGKPCRYRRLGSVGAGADGHILDLYLIVDSTGAEYKIFLDMYHPEIHPKEAKAPKGFSK